MVVFLRTELNRHGLVFDELINGQTVMHYRHRLTASLAYMITLTYESTTDHCPLISSSKTKPRQFTSV